MARGDARGGCGPARRGVARSPGRSVSRPTGRAGPPYATIRALGAGAGREEDRMKNKWALVALAGAQFIMVLDQSVMNVSISQLVADFDTTVTTIQAVITLYCLVMAMLMLTGGKIGDIIGRRRAFVIGLVIYACGSALTAVSQTVAAADPGMVDPRGNRRGPGAAGDGRADRRQLRGQGAQGRLRGDRRRRGCRHRHRPHRGRVGHHRADLAGGLPGRGRHRPRHPRHDPLRRRRSPYRPEAPARRRRLDPGRNRSRRRRAGRPAVDHLGTDPAEGLARRAVRPRPDPLRHRRRRAAALGLRGLAAPPGGHRAATRWSTSTS